TIKSQIDYACPTCAFTWLPYAPGLHCPQCARPVPEKEVTEIIQETLESAKFNKRLYGKFELEFWLARRLGDRYLQWAFKALDLAEKSPELSAEKVALATLLDLDLEEMTPYREHILGYLAASVEAYRKNLAQRPEDWQKNPEPEK